jgi:VanZ family protein
MNEPRPAWSWLFFAQLALVILATVLATFGCFPPVLFRPPFDKVGHLGAYGLLAFFGVTFFGHARRWWVVGALLVAATLEEFSQRAFPTRTFDLGDLAMNVVGICVFGALAAALSAARRRPRPPPPGPRPGLELDAIEPGGATSVDVALVRQCGEEDGLRVEVRKAERELVRVRAAFRPPDPGMGALRWFLFMFGVHFLVGACAFYGLSQR